MPICIKISFSRKMTAQTDLTDLINVLRKGTPEELGKAWRERYKTIYKHPSVAKMSPAVKKFDDFIHSDKSYLLDLDGELPSYAKSSQ